MSQELVRVRIDDIETNVGAAFAEAEGLEVLDEPTTNPDGSRREETRVNGRKAKPKTSVAEKAAEKSANGS